MEAAKPREGIQWYSSHFLFCYIYLLGECLLFLPLLFWTSFPSAYQHIHTHRQFKSIKNISLGFHKLRRKYLRQEWFYLKKATTGSCYVYVKTCLTYNRHFWTSNAYTHADQVDGVFMIKHQILVTNLLGNV